VEKRGILKYIVEKRGILKLKHIFSVILTSVFLQEISMELDDNTSRNNNP